MATSRWSPRCSEEGAVAVAEMATTEAAVVDAAANATVDATIDRPEARARPRARVVVVENAAAPAASGRSHRRARRLPACGPPVHIVRRQ